MHWFQQISFVRHYPSNWTFQKQRLHVLQYSIFVENKINMSRSKEAHINDVLNLEAHCLADMARVRGLPGDSRASVTNLDRLFLICSSQDILSYSSLFCHTLVILFDASYSKGQNCPNVYDFLFSTRFLCQYFFWARQIGNKDSLAINVTMWKVSYR